MAPYIKKYIAFQVRSSLAQWATGGPKVLALFTAVILLFNLLAAGTAGLAIGYDSQDAVIVIGLLFAFWTMFGPAASERGKRKDAS